MMKYLIVLAAMASQGCNHNHPPAPLPGDVDAGPATCATACANGERLGCDWSRATPMGHTCSEVCGNAAQSVPWNIVGLSKATSCR